VAVQNIGYQVMVTSADVAVVAVAVVGTEVDILEPDHKENPRDVPRSGHEDYKGMAEGRISVAIYLSCRHSMVR
jgi:hypothetical protein